jgi:hypothetical protein
MIAQAGLQWQPVIVAEQLSTGLVSSRHATLPGVCFLQARRSAGRTAGRWLRSYVLPPPSPAAGPANGITTSPTSRH